MSTDTFEFINFRHLRQICLMVIKDLNIDERVAFQVFKSTPFGSEFNIVYDPAYDIQPLHEIGVEALRLIADVLAIKYGASVNYIIRQSKGRYYTYLTVNGEAVGHYRNPDFEVPMLSPGDPAKWS